MAKTPKEMETRTLATCTLLTSPGPSKYAGVGLVVETGSGMESAVVGKAFGSFTGDHFQVGKVEWLLPQTMECKEVGDIEKKV